MASAFARSICTDASGKKIMRSKPGSSLTVSLIACLGREANQASQARFRMLSAWSSFSLVICSMLICHTTLLEIASFLSYEQSGEIFYLWFLRPCATYLLVGVKCLTVTPFASQCQGCFYRGFQIGTALL